MTRITRATEDRERLFTIGTWLVGLGAVFLVKEIMRWEWTQAWPLFVILLGVGSTVSAWLARGHTRLGPWGIWWPVAIVVVGVLLLAATTGLGGTGLGEVLRWWPLVAVGVGAWFLIGALIGRDNTPAVEALTIPLQGLAQAEVRLHFGGGQLRIGPAAPGVLLSGHFTGGVLQRELRPGSVQLEPFEPQLPFWSGRGIEWDVALTHEIPVDLRIESAANRSSIDLAPLRVRRLELKTGASETEVRLPRTGATSVRAEVGLAALSMEVPAGASARIRSKMGLASVTVDEARFPRSLEGWASPEFESAADRIDIEIEGGLGSVRVS